MFGDDYEELENCGVEFDPTCKPNSFVPTDAELEELLGECEEGDDECIARYLRQIRKPSQSSPLQSKKGSFQDKDGKSATDPISSPLSGKGPLSPALPTPEPLFEGLSKTYFRKNYKPDYPTDLQMKQVCTSKALRRRSLGTTRTHPKAIFIPSLTTLAKQEQKGGPGVGRKSNALGGSPMTVEKPASTHAIFMEEPSPLEQNRLPPQVSSSSDEIIVEWLESHNVQLLFEYFLGLCVIHQPTNPWTFISELCAKMMEARTDLVAFDNLPRILTPEHSEAIFRIYDRIENGYITVPQYKSAMDAMGLNRYSITPEGWEQNAISKDTFVKEATEAIDGLLRTFMVYEQPPTAYQGSKMDLLNSKSVLNAKRDSYSGSGTSSSEAQSRSRSGSDNVDNASVVDVLPPVDLPLQY